MTRYDHELEIGLEEALAEAQAKLNAMVTRRLLGGATNEAIIEALLADLETDGPILGRMVRQIGGVAQSAALTATRQGSLVGHAAENATARRLLARAGRPDLAREILGDPDPETVDEVEEILSDDMPFTWIATLRNTCPRCLPLHGTARTMREWKQAGVLPETIHDGWVSACYCILVPSDMAESTRELAAPLRRVPVEGKGKRTQRDIAAVDVDKALAARDAALKTKAGRSLLRRLGQSGEI